MAKFVIKTQAWTWNSVDLADHLRGGALTLEGDPQDMTAMAASGIPTQEMAGGILRWGWDGTLFGDEAASKVQVTLFPDVQNSTRTFLTRPLATAVSTTNPNYTGTGLLSSIGPLSGNVGEPALCAVRIVSAGALSRATS